MIARLLPLVKPPKIGATRLTLTALAGEMPTLQLFGPMRVCNAGANVTLDSKQLVGMPVCPGRAGHVLQVEPSREGGSKHKSVIPGGFEKSKVGP